MCRLVLVERTVKIKLSFSLLLISLYPVVSLDTLCIINARGSGSVFTVKERKLHNLKNLGENFNI